MKNQHFLYKFLLKFLICPHLHTVHNKINRNKFIKKFKLLFFSCQNSQTMLQFQLVRKQTILIRKELFFMNHLRQVLDQYYNFWFSLNALYENWAKTKNLTCTSLMILYLIYQNPDTCTQHFICQRLSLPKQTVNSILHGLEQKGYVQKITNNQDKRSKLLSFTDAGLSYAEPILQEMFQLEELALSRFSRQEQENLLHSSGQLVEQLTKTFFPEKQSQL